MSNKKFDEKKSREMVVSFLRRLQKECDENLTIMGSERLQRVFDFLSNDITGAETWKTIYLMTFGKPLELISANEAFTTLIGFCAQQTHICKFNLLGLMDLLFLIRYQPEKNPEEHEKERAIWKEVVNFFSAKDPLYVNDKEMKAFNKHSWNFIDRKGLEIWKFGTLISNFTGEIDLTYRDLLLDSTIDALFAYHADLCMNSTYDELYEETYEKISGIPRRKDLYLTEEELFTLMIEICALHICQWGFKMKEILALLFAMRYSPENHKKDIAIWKEILTASRVEPIL